MRKLAPSFIVAIVLVATLIAALLIGVSHLASTQQGSAVTMCRSRSVVDLERGSNSGAVMFYVTNAEPRLVHLARLEVQVSSTNDWKTVSTETAPIFGPGGPSYRWAGGLLPGSYRTFYVQPPLEGSWRVRLTYLRQERGFYSFLVRTKALVRGLTGWASLFQWSRGNVLRLSDQHQVVSQEFSQ